MSEWCCVWRGKPGDFVCRDRESIALRSVDVSTYCQRRLQASLKYSLCDLKAMLPTSAWINQYIPKFLYCLDYYSSVCLVYHYASSDVTWHLKTSITSMAGLMSSQVVHHDLPV